MLKYSALAVILLFLAGCATQGQNILYQETWIPKMLVPPRLEVIVVADDKTATEKCEKRGITRPYGVGGCYYAFNPEWSATLVTGPEWWKILHEFLHMLGYKEAEIPDALQPWGQR